MSTSSEVVPSALPSVMCANVRSREWYLTRFRRRVENVAGDTSEEEEASSSSLRFMVGGLNHGCRMC